MTKAQWDRLQARRVRLMKAAGTFPSESEFVAAVLAVRREFLPKLRRVRRENAAQLKLWVN